MWRTALIPPPPMFLFAFHYWVNTRQRCTLEVTYLLTRCSASRCAYHPEWCCSTRSARAYRCPPGPWCTPRCRFVSCLASWSTAIPRNSGVFRGFGLIDLKEFKYGSCLASTTASLLSVRTYLMFLKRWFSMYDQNAARLLLLRICSGVYEMHSILSMSLKVHARWWTLDSGNDPFKDPRSIILATSNLKQLKVGLSNECKLNRL